MFSQSDVEWPQQKIYQGALINRLLLLIIDMFIIVLTTHSLAYLCCQCDASLDMKLALGLVVARSKRRRYPLSSP